MHVLRFADGQATFTCSGQLVHYQRMQVFGTTGRIDVEIQFSPQPDRSARIFLDDGSTLGSSGTAIELPAVDQFALQADRFAEAVRGLGDVPVSLEDSIGNMATIDALFRSADSGRWEAPR